MDQASSSTDIAGDIARRIETGEYSHGRRVAPERTLAETYGVSRTLMRDALSQLERDGYVQRRPGSGTYVTWAGTAPVTLAIDNVRPLELIDARFAVEPHMVRLAVLHATERDLMKVETEIRRGEKALREPRLFADADEAYHMALAACSNNALITWMMTQIHQVRNLPQWERMRTLTLDREMIIRYNGQHAQIVDAIRARDPEMAAQVMKAHLNSARMSLMNVAE